MNLKYDGKYRLVIFENDNNLTQITAIEFESSELAYDYFDFCVEKYSEENLYIELFERNEKEQTWKTIETAETEA